MNDNFSFKSKFTSRVERIQISAIKQMPLLARGMSDVVSLGQGIPFPRTPAHVRRAVRKILEENEIVGRYSQQPGLPELKIAVAKKVSSRSGCEVDPEREIFISAGAMEAVFTAITSLAEEGDEVILFDPGYASHIEQVLFAGAKPVFVPLQEERGWAVDPDILSKAITSRTKAILVNNPSNPTGKVFSAEELRMIVDLALAHGLAVIADETYDFLVYPGSSFISLTEFPEIRPQLIACFSFSKEYSMTGWRVGYMYAPAEVIAQALKVHDAVVICAPTVSQYAALAALSEEADSGETTVSQVLQHTREVICRRLEALPELFSFVKPQGSHFVLPRYLKTTLPSAEFAKKVLYDAKVITIPGGAFGPNGEGHIRLSFAGTEAEINEAFDRLELWNKSL